MVVVVADELRGLTEWILEAQVDDRWVRVGSRRG
jgi:hypothetical protein